MNKLSICQFMKKYNFVILEHMVLLRISVAQTLNVVQRNGLVYHLIVHL
jgi:hypothetical protein